ncbi:MAG: hypothetical protein WD971_04745 [Pirellulales bacterium]
MRLTLRTLLAYMDEILEPADREELAKKVESSEFAHDLIHRTKDTMRRLRLSAPQVVGTGIGLDPNTVAEYLDNILPPDSVADFERICLESDVHLAEVASAHHVLTMVLGEPAEVDPAARQRMYSIPAEAERRKHLRIEPAHVAPAAVHDYAAVTPPPSVFPPASIAPATQTYSDAIPDYLRASAWTRHGTLLAACAAVLLLAVSWLVYTSMSGWFGGAQQVALGPTNNGATNLQPPAEPATETLAVPSPSTNETSTSETPLGASPTSDSETTAMPSAAAPPRLLLPSLGSATPSTPPQEPATSTEAVAQLPVVAVDERAYGYDATRAESDNRHAADNSPTSPPSTEVAASSAAVVPDVVAPDQGAELPVADIQATDTETVAATPAAPAELGTYLDGENVLLRFDPQAGAWFRMTPRATLHPGDRLLALPAFYPKLSLASGLHLKLAGGTLITLGPAAAGSNEPTIDVGYGKVVLVNTSNDESGLKLTIGGQTADVRLSHNATLAVDVVPKYLPGQDPRESPSPIVAALYVRDGDVVWNDASGSRSIPAPGQWNIEGGAPSTVSADVTFPDWIDQEPVEQRSEQLFGAPKVEQTLDPSRPAEEQLLELYQSSNRREVKSLVARSSVYVGLFVPFVEALRDSDQKSSWKTHIDTLRSAMSLGPESAEKIYQTLDDQRGNEAANDLYQMLCGYDAQQIGTADEFRSGLAAQLVDWMENDSLDYRVLAVQDMGDITGMRLMPNPAGAPTERARGIRLWRQRLKAGEVAPVSP